MDPHFDGVIFQTHAAELQRRLRRQHPPLVVLDTRAAAERARGVLPGSVALRSSDLAALPEGTGPATEFVVVGRDQYDEEARRTTLRLRALGARRIVELTGGMFEWESQGFPLAPAVQAA
jgi:rhodanese-related sulfurtransferase